MLQRKDNRLRYTWVSLDRTYINSNMAILTICIILWIFEAIWCTTIEFQYPFNVTIKYPIYVMRMAWIWIAILLFIWYYLFTHLCNMVTCGETEKYMWDGSVQRQCLILACITPSQTYFLIMTDRFFVISK